MTLKKFLKPEYRKLVVFVILVCIGFLIYVITPKAVTTGPSPPPTIGEYITSLIILILFIPFFITFLIVPISFSILNYIYGTGIILTFIYWYLLSCFIVWIYDKVKKK